MKPWPLAVVLLALAASPAAAQYEISWWTVDGGGATGAVGGTYTLSGTAGQPDAGGPYAGGSYTLHSGFWSLAAGGAGASADLSITKTDGAATAVPGQAVTYTIVASNAGPTAVTAAAVADTLPAAVTGATWTCTASAGLRLPRLRQRQHRGERGPAGRRHRHLHPHGHDRARRDRHAREHGQHRAAGGRPGSGPRQQRRDRYGHADAAGGSLAREERLSRSRGAGRRPHLHDRRDEPGPVDVAGHDGHGHAARAGDVRLRHGRLRERRGHGDLHGRQPGPGGPGHGDDPGDRLPGSDDEPQQHRDRDRRRRRSRRRRTTRTPSRRRSCSSAPRPSSSTARGSSADLAGAGGVADVDHYRISQKPFSSYEVVVDGTSGDVGAGAGPLVDRLLSDGTTVVQTSQAVGVGPSRTLRFANTTSATVDGHLVRVRSGSCGSDCGADDVYRIRAWETTGSIPRFNNSATQVTVLVLQNRTSAPVSWTAYFWSSAGSQVVRAPAGRAGPECQPDPEHVRASRPCRGRAAASRSSTTAATTGSPARRSRWSPRPASPSTRSSSHGRAEVDSRFDSCGGRSWARRSATIRTPPLRGRGAPLSSCASGAPRRSPGTGRPR